MPNEGEEEDGGFVKKGLATADYGHLTADAAVEGDTSAATWGEMTAKMGHEASEVFTGEGTAAQTAMSGSTALLAPLAVAGGIWEMIEGYKKGGVDGGFGMAEGALTAGSGAAGVAGLAGIGTGVAAAPALLAGATGMKVTRYGDEEVKELGWLHDGDGESESASEWAGRTGKSADDAVNHWVTKHAHSHLLGRALGTGAGVITTLGATVPAAEMALAGAAVGGAKAVGRAASWGASETKSAVLGGMSVLGGAGEAAGDALAHRTRASHYDHYDGMTVQGGGQSLADYDDAQQAAVKRADEARNAAYWKGVRGRITADPDAGFFGAARAQSDADQRPKK